MRVVISTMLVVLVGAAMANASPALRPTVTVLDRTPVTIRGTGFGARERVLVTVNSGLVRAMQPTRATYRGSFVVSFDGLRLPCAGATVVATGARGHVARLKLALRECPGPIIEP